ncbi:MAG: PD40 domain-containing protein [Bacteroidia bacterium]|nr:PD40 domain-containing protein [Bacteroidia bacterium]
MKSLKILFLVVFLSPGIISYAQNEKKALKNAERHLSFEEWAQAIPYLEEAVGINPKSAESHWLLGKCYYLTYRKAKAEKEFGTAYELDPEISNELNYYYARSLHYVLKFDQAILFYKKAAANYRTSDPEFHRIENSIRNCEYGKEAIKHPVDAQIRNIGGVINTPWSEHSPVITADESMMIFTSRRPGNMGSTKDNRWHDEDIYITYKDDKGKWGTPTNLGKDINSKDHDASIGLSLDGQTMFLYKNPPGNGDIFKSTLSGTNWSQPQNLGTPINTKNYETTVSLSPDGKTIFFASDREGGLGDLDIYTSTLEADGKWSKPINLGPDINTRGADDSPFIHPDGRTLYFSSDGRENESIGGYDIYKSELKEDGSWTKPENIGYPINTPDDDIYFVLSANGYHGYYASAKEGGYGEKDIYLIEMPQPPAVVVEEKDTAQEVVPVVVKASLTILKGTVTDARTGEPLEASIKVIDNEQNLIISEFKSNSVSGKYLVSLPSGRNYGIRVESPDYLFHSENFDIPSSQAFLEVTKDVQLKKIMIGESIVLRNIFFDHDKSTLRPESVSELERLLAILQENKGMSIEIAGHTDNVGSDTYNEKLSQDRAQAVVDFLIGKGIDKGRLQAKGYGEAKPIDTNDTAEGRQNNRRTEFTILKN